MGKRSRVRVEHPDVQKTTHSNILENGFGGGAWGGVGIGGGLNDFGFPGDQNTAFTPAISNPTTAFINLRWFLVSNDRQFLSEMYVELGLVQAIVDIPVDDALRGGVEIKSKELSEEQLEELTNSVDRDDDLTTVGQGAKWTRHYGGGGILILTDQDPKEPLSMDQIGPDDPLEFRAVDMWELFWDKSNTQGYDPSIQSEDFDFYTYYGLPVHKSRVMRMVGITAPSFIRPRIRGWGVSVIETLIRSLNQYLKATDLGFQVLDEFKIDVYKIKNLVNTLMQPQGFSSVRKTIAQINRMKNYQNAIVIDSEDEYIQKQLSFSGLAETMQGIRMQVASDMRMPMIKLFGTPATGLNAGDEDSIEVYNSMVESQVRNKIKYIILRMLEIKCQKLFGFVPEDLSLSFKPLRVMSEEQEQKIKDSKLKRLIDAKTAGLISPDEARDGINRAKVFDISLTGPAPVPVSQSMPGMPQPGPDGGEQSQSMGGYNQDTVREGTNDPYIPEDTDNPGADRLDSRKPRATTVGGAPKDIMKKSGAPKTDSAPPPPRSSDEPDSIARFKPKKETSTKTKMNAIPSISSVYAHTPVDPPEADGLPPGTTDPRAPVVKKYTGRQLANRFFALNSIDFDKASYELDGGDGWIDSRRLGFYEHVGDPGLLSRCKDESRQAYGSENEKFTLWLYLKKGGKIKEFEYNAQEEEGGRRSTHGAR